MLLHAMNTLYAAITELRKIVESQLTWTNRLDIGIGGQHLTVTAWWTSSGNSHHSQAFRIRWNVLDHAVNPIDLFMQELINPMLQAYRLSLP